MDARTETTAIYELLDCLFDFYDDSELQPPIKKGDRLHRAIVSYRESLPGKVLRSPEGGLKRRLLDLSRSKKIAERRAAQDVAEEWAMLIEQRKIGQEKDVIPAEYRTVPLSLNEAARLMFSVTKSADVRQKSRLLRKMIDDGPDSMPAILCGAKLVFDARKFPARVRPEIAPQA